MLPQGTSVSDTDYINSLTAQINAINVCSELQSVVNAAFASLQAEINAVESQVAALQLVQVLLELPTDLGSAITWITNFVNSLIKPILLPIEIYIAQLEALVTAVANLTTAIENAAARIGNCSITVPTITIPIS